MSAASRTLVYFLHGDLPEHRNELIYSILSAYRFSGSGPAFDILLLTDAQNALPFLPIRHKVLPDDILARWTDQGAYVHAAKYEALKFVLTEYGGTAIMVDTDTVLDAHPSVLFDRIADDRMLLHVDEGEIGQQSLWTPVLEAGPVVVGETTLTPQIRMYNAGILGLTERNIDLLDRVLAFSKALYYRTSIFCVCQISFDALLRDRVLLTTCEDVVRHYYGSERRFYRIKIARLFPEISAELFERHLQNYPDLRGFERASFPHRIVARIKARWRRQGAAFGFARQAYLSALSCRDPEIARAWGHTVLDMLQHLDPPPRHLAKDFAAFRAEGLNGLDWADRELKDRWAAFWATRS